MTNKTIALDKLTIAEDMRPGYGPRTYVNAKSADLTVAFAVDFTSAGEITTYKAAAGKYVSINLHSDTPETAARRIVDYMGQYDVKCINIAGNGIYTLVKYGWSQERINLFVFSTLRLLVSRIDHPELSIRSGGQTGVDWAGLVAGVALGLTTTGYWPRNFRMRDCQKQDFYHSSGVIPGWLQQDAAKVLEGL